MAKVSATRAGVLWKNTVLTIATLLSFREYLSFAVCINAQRNFSRLVAFELVGKVFFVSNACNTDDYTFLSTPFIFNL